MEMRASLQDKDESKTLKAKMRERARPKLGKIDIDYQKLHDAFFKSVFYIIIVIIQCYMFFVHKYINFI